MSNYLLAILKNFVHFFSKFGKIPGMPVCQTKNLGSQKPAKYALKPPMPPIRNFCSKTNRKWPKCWDFDQKTVKMTKNRNNWKNRPKNLGRRRDGTVAFAVPTPSVGRPTVFFRRFYRPADGSDGAKGADGANGADVADRADNFDMVFEHGLFANLADKKVENRLKWVIFDHISKLKTGHFWC